MFTIGNLSNLFRTIVYSIGSAFGIGKGDMHESVSKIAKNATALPILLTPVKVLLPVEALKIENLGGERTSIEKIVLKITMRLTQVMTVEPKLTKAAERARKAAYDLFERQALRINASKSAPDLHKRLNKILENVTEIVNNPFVSDVEKGLILKHAERDLYQLMTPFLLPLEQKKKQDQFFIQDQVEAFKAVFQQFNGFNEQIKVVQTSVNALLNAYRLDAPEMNQEAREVLTEQINSLLRNLTGLSKSTQNSSGNPFLEEPLLNIAQVKVMRVNLNTIKTQCDGLVRAFFPKRMK